LDLFNGKEKPMSVHFYRFLTAKGFWIKLCFRDHEWRFMIRLSHYTG
jgi:hypothetical protein